MVPVHILITVSSHDDVSLPLLLGQISKDTGAPFRISVFLTDSAYAPAVREMAKTFVQIDNPLLRKLRVARIACFDANTQPDSPIDLVLANRIEDLQTLAVHAQTVVLNHVPATAPDTSRYNNLTTPFQQLADIVIANCAEKEGIAHEDIAHLGCFSRADDLVVHTRQAVDGHTRHFQADTEIAIQAMHDLALDTIPQRFAGAVFVSSYLRSWQKNITTTGMRRAKNGTLEVEAIMLRKGEITPMRAIDEAAKNAARHLANIAA